MGKANSRKCASGKIMNPKTGRCVSKTGKIGMGLMGKKPSPGARKSPAGKSKGCPSGKIMNPKTGRCVSKTGKIGMGLMGKKPREGKPRAGAGAGKPKPEPKPEEPRAEPKEDEPRDKNKSYKPEYVKWYKYYYNMFVVIKCNDINAREIIERDIIDDSDSSDTVLRRSALTEVIKIMNEECDKMKKEETGAEPTCEVDKYNPDELSCKITSSLLLHPDKNPTCPIKASAKFDKWRSRCKK